MVWGLDELVFRNTPWESIEAVPSLKLRLSPLKKKMRPRRRSWKDGAMLVLGRVCFHKQFLSRLMGIDLLWWEKLCCEPAVDVLSRKSRCFFFETYSGLVDASDDLTETCLLQHGSICLWHKCFGMSRQNWNTTSKDTQYLDPSSHQSHPKWNSTALL